MKIALVTTCYLDIPEYFDKTIKWIEYYSNNNTSLKFDHILLLDNNSSIENIKKLQNRVSNKVKVHCFQEHLTRTSHLEYPYLWRAVDYFKHILNDYSKLFYMDNDFYILSKSMSDYINNLENTWWSPYCNKHRFPETGLQVLTKDYLPYLEFVKQPYMSYNGKCMETTLPITVDKTFSGDRYSEYPGPFIQTEWMDFAAQVRLEDKVAFLG